MSKKHPQCPLYAHENCKELHNPKLCAIVRKDEVCLRKPPKTRRKAPDEMTKQTKTCSKCKKERPFSFVRIGEYTLEHFSNVAPQRLSRKQKPT